MTRADLFVGVGLPATGPAWLEIAVPAQPVARSQLEAPEVDGVIYVKGAKAAKLQPGDIIKAEVIDALDYDLVAKI